MTKRMKRTINLCLAAGLMVKSHGVWRLYVSIAQTGVG